jgi:ABC-type thiamin/hydroxymethylpyrimidine transport system permease subunit
MTTTTSTGARAPRRCLIASAALLVAFLVEAQFYDPARPLPSLLLLGGITFGLWCVATVAATVLYLTIGSAWLTAKYRRYR